MRRTLTGYGIAVIIVFAILNGIAWWAGRPPLGALTAAMANNRRSTDAGFDAAPDEWIKLIRVFATLNSHETVAASKNQISSAANLSSAPSQRQMTWRRLSGDGG
jgi:hypothetical protein